MENPQQKSFPRLTGQVVGGDHEGREIGFPTANIKLDQELSEHELKTGVYLASAIIEELGKDKFYGLAYFGPKLVKNQTINNFEIFFFDFDQDIYGLEVKIDLISFMRPPMPFPSMEAMKTQLKTDKKEGLALLS